MRNKFKRFGGQAIPDIIEYLKEHIKVDPNVTISVGTDSVQRRRKTVYAITIMLYNTDIRNGAHVIFYRENLTKVRDHFDRLQKESEYALKLAEMLDTELSGHFTRTDLDEKERKRYKYHLLCCNGDYSHISNEDAFINNISLTDSEKSAEYKLVDIHLDYNPKEGTVDRRGVAKNKSNMSYKAFVPWIRSMGFRVFSKNIAHAASSAADLLLKD